jgi:membrane-associated phospholipid phosphatase
MDLLERLDQGVLTWLQAHRMPWLTTAMLGITFLGERGTLLVVVVAAAVWLGLRHHYRTALLLAVTGLGGGELVNLVKNLIQRERPAQTVAELVLSTYSFPSGHALGSTAVYVTLALLVSRQLSRRRDRILLVGAGVLLAGLIGFSRLYLGAHYLTDVVAGWAGGLGCAFLAAWVQDWWAAPREPPR